MPIEISSACKQKDRNMDFSESSHDEPSEASSELFLPSRQRSRNHHQELDHAREVDQQEAVSDPRDRSFPFTCPNPTEYSFLNEDTGEVIPQGCGKQTCAACVFLIVWRTVGAIRLATPNYMLRLSHTGESWPEIKRNMQQFNRAMRTTLGAHAWAGCFIAHENPSGDGQTHVHMLARTSHLSEELVQEKATKVGMGREVHLQSIDSKGLSYAFHPITDARDLDFETATVEIEHHLAINGSRLVHKTGNFWRSRNGRPSTLKEARAASTSTETWRVIANRRDGI